MSVEWLCKRCSIKLGKSIEPEPMVLRRCSGCDVENYCYPSGHAGEDAEPEKTADIARSQAAVHGKAEGVIIEAETVVDEQDNEVAEETAPSAAEPSLPEEAPVEEENTTMSKEEQIRAQIAELKAQLEADKE